MLIILIIAPSPNTINLNTTTPSSRLHLGIVRPKTIIFKLHNHWADLHVSCFFMFRGFRVYQTVKGLD